MGFKVFAQSIKLLGRKVVQWFERWGSARYEVDRTIVRPVRWKLCRELLIEDIRELLVLVRQDPESLGLLTIRWLNDGSVNELLLGLAGEVYSR